jgi:hypothetical protein
MPLVIRLPLGSVVEFQMEEWGNEFELGSGTQCTVGAEDHESNLIHS